MKAILYLIIFIMGTFFGSFSAYAVHRIPQKKSITKEKSYCPNCNHKLGIFDMIPILSFIFLGGKCRYCRKKIPPVYFIVEVLMGIVSVGVYFSIHSIWGTMSILTLTEYLYLMAFITTISIIAGLDRKYKKVYKPVIFTGCLIGLVHIIYLYIIKSTTLASIYIYCLYFLIICVLSIITGKYRYFKYRYLLEIMMICIYINMFVVSEAFLITAVLTMIFLILDIIRKKRKIKIDKSDILAEENENLDLPIAFWLCISNIVALLIQGIAL